MDWAGPSVLRGRPSGAAPAVHAALSRARSCADHHRDLKPPQIFTSPIDVLNTCFFLKPKIQPGLNNVFLEEAGGRGSRMMVMVMVMPDLPELLFGLE